MICRQCGNGITGKKVYCNDACRMAYARNPNKADAQPEHQPEQMQPEHEQVATRTNPDLINHGKPLSPHGLKKAGMKANRVPIPGDHDYSGVCEQVDGRWQVIAS